MKRKAATGRIDYCWQGQDEVLAINVVIAYSITPRIEASYHRLYGWSPPEGEECEWWIERYGQALVFSEAIELSAVQRAQFDDMLTENHYDEIAELCREREACLAERADDYEERD
jgi:hypothetical protein